MEANQKPLGDTVVEPTAKADPTAVETKEPYKSFADKEELTAFIKKELKKFKEENDTLKNEMNSLKRERQIDSIQKDLKIFNEDTKEFIIGKLDFSKDIKEQIDELKEKYPSLLKGGVSITNKDGKENEKKSSDIITDGRTKVFL